MSRKAKQLEEAEGDLSSVRYWGAAFGYSLPKESALLGEAAGGGHVVVLHLPEDPAAPDGGDAVRAMATVARCVLPSSPEGGTAPLVVLDLSALFKSPQEAREALDAEGEMDGVLGKALGKPAGRALAKLLPRSVTLVARGGAAQLALKLLSASGSRLRPDAVARLVLVHPRLPAKCVNALLARARFGQRLCAAFESEEAQARRLPMLQAAFRSPGACFACAEPQEALLRALLGLGQGQPLPEVPGLTEEDEVGRALWLFHLSITMDPNSKQNRADVEDASHLLDAAADADGGGDAPKGISEASTSAGGDEAEVAALLVRGSRCVLVRSLASPPAWRGMRLPLAAPLPGEEPLDAAVRAVSDLCDIDGAAEVVPLPLPPVHWYRGSGVAQIVVLKAVNPPPAGPLEEADMEDEEDLYDWYTWPRAMHALRGDPMAVMALQTAALTLMTAAVAGRVPFEWGGVFGQEWTRSIVTEKPVALHSTSGLPQLPFAGPPTASAEQELPSLQGPVEAVKLLPVTVLSGFLGAGKTTLLKHILRSGGLSAEAQNDGAASQSASKFAVIVNDMGEVNLDASEIKNARLLQEEADMVELHNGCICCTLRGDLLKTVKALSEEKAFDCLIIESTGISEPLPVAQTFVMDVDGAEVASVPHRAAQGSLTDEHHSATAAVTEQVRSLSHFARLDTMVTVVDALNIYDVLDSLETLAEKNSTNMVGNTGILGETSADSGESDSRKQSNTEQHEHHDHKHGEELDDRSIAQLMLDQIEFANVILLSKAHLVEQGPRAVEELCALLQRLNPSAKIIAPAGPHFADLPVSSVINTGLFDMEQAQVSAGWVQELAKSADGGAGHTPETEEYGISSVVFRCRERPFHPGRLRGVLAGLGTYASSVALGEGGAGSTSSLHAATFSGVVRAKGQLWVASANAYPVDFHAAGRHVQLVPSSRPYLAATARHEWDQSDHEQCGRLVAEGTWHFVHGDRESEVVFIGVALDRARILDELSAALLTDAEAAGGSAGWKAFEDVFFGGRYFEILSEEQGAQTMGSEDGHGYSLKVAKER